MYARGWDYPLHLGVTEAGEGEDGRMKSAIGIGALLMDGLGDTIRWGGVGGWGPVVLEDGSLNDMLGSRGQGRMGA